MGASPATSSNFYGRRVFASLVNAGSAANLYPVNPRYEGQEIEGRQCYSSVRGLPEVPDLVVIVTPANVVHRVLEDCAALGVLSCVVVSASFGDAEARRTFDEGISRISTQSGMRVVGPNSMGVIHAPSGLNATFSTGIQGRVTPGGVGVVAQSGSVISYMLQTLQSSGVGYSWMFSTGNESGATLESLFESVVDDPETRVIVLFIEGLSDGPRFRQAAQLARLHDRAVLVMNVGVTDAGRAAVATHSGRMAGGDSALDALTFESGVQRVATYDQLFDRVQAFDLYLRRPESRRIRQRRAVVLTTSGGAGSYTTDHLGKLGWGMVALPPDVRHELAEIAGQNDIDNPVDVTGAFADPTLLPRLMHALTRIEDEVGAIVIATGAGGTLGERVAAGVVEASLHLETPVFVGWAGIRPEVRRIFGEGGVPAFADPARAVSAAEACAEYTLSHRRRSASIATAHQPQTTGTRTPSKTHWAIGEVLDDLAGDLLQVAPYRLVSAGDSDAAIAAARELGFPVGLKLDSADVSHKVEHGALRLDLRTPDEVAAASLGLADLIDRGGIQDARIIVQKMVRGVELFAGMTRDPVFGMLFLIGLGGTNVELSGRVVPLLFPVTAEAIAETLAGVEGVRRVLSGYRGGPAVDLDRLADRLAGLASWCESKAPFLLEADFNPVMANGRDAWVVDGRAVWDTAVPDVTLTDTTTRGD